MRVRNQRITATLLVAFFGLVTVLTVAGFARTWRPAVATEHGQGVDDVIDYLLWTTGAILVAGHAALIAFVWRYSRPGDVAEPAVSPRAEWSWALAPALTMAVVSEVGVLFLGLPVFGKMYGPAPEGALELEIVGKQFEWIVRYPGKDGEFGRAVPEKVNDARNPLGLDKKDAAARDDVVLRGTMHLPLGRAVSLRIRSQDVLHSFSVAAFRVKQDAVPGYPTHVQFVPTVAGKYEIACAELCGLGHYRMRGFAIVEETAAFDAWIAGQLGWFE